MIRHRLSSPDGVLLVAKILLIAAGLYLTNQQVVEGLIYFLDFNLYFQLLVFLGIWG